MILDVFSDHYLFGDCSPGRDPGGVGVKADLQLLGEVVGPAVGALRLLGHRQQRVQGLPQPTLISTILELQTINRFSQSRRRSLLESFHI